MHYGIQYLCNELYIEKGGAKVRSCYRKTVEKAEFHEFSQFAYKFISLQVIHGNLFA